MAILIGIAVLVLIIAVIAFVATRPTDFRVQRSAQIDAPADVVFSIINDLHQWGRWSPYDKRDPNMKKTFGGPSAGLGANYAWNGNNQVGEGRLIILESKPGELVTMRLEFSRPFKANNQVNFKIVPSDGGTRVSWIMDGKYNFITKLMSAIMDMDKMAGTDFEHGLANLNTVAQAETQRSGQSAQARRKLGNASHRPALSRQIGNRTVSVVNAVRARKLRRSNLFVALLVALKARKRRTPTPSRASLPA